MASALIINDVPIECINQAAIVYQVPASLLISVLKVENGRAGMAQPNRNGTFDYGPMQINSIWLKKLTPYGYTQQQVQYDPCINMFVGAWILSHELSNSPAVWQGVGNYHSHTPMENAPYQTKVHGIYQKMMNYISNPMLPQVTPEPPINTIPPPVPVQTIARSNLVMALPEVAHETVATKTPDEKTTTSKAAEPVAQANNTADEDIADKLPNTIKTTTATTDLGPTIERSTLVSAQSS